MFWAESNPLRQKTQLREVNGKNRMMVNTFFSLWWAGMGCWTWLYISLFFTWLAGGLWTGKSFLRTPVLKQDAAGDSQCCLTWMIFPSWSNLCRGSMSLCHWDPFSALTTEEPWGKGYTLHRKSKDTGLWNPSAADVFWVRVPRLTPRWVW